MTTGPTEAFVVSVAAAAVVFVESDTADTDCSVAEVEDGAVPVVRGLVEAPCGPVVVACGLAEVFGAATSCREEFVGLSFPQVKSVAATRQRITGNPTLAVRYIK